MRQVFKNGLNNICEKQPSLQTHYVDSTLKRRGNNRFHVVSMWNPRGVFVGFYQQTTESISFQIF